MKTKFTLAILGLSLSLLFVACKKDNDNPKPDDNTNDTGVKYLLSLKLPAQESYPVHIVNNISAGTADIAGAQELPEGDATIINSKNGYIYATNSITIVKYAVSDNGLMSSEGAIAHLGPSGAPVSCFVDDQNLFVTTFNKSNKTGVYEYQLVNTTDMSVTSASSFTVPEAANATSWMSAYIFKEGKIYVPFVISGSDSGYVAVVDAATQAYEKTLITNKTMALGHQVNSGSGIDESGNLYIAGCNSDYWNGSSENVPAGIVRIPAGSSDFDSYFFDVQSEIANTINGFAYASNGKAVVQTFNKSLITASNDYASKFATEYYEVDLNAKTAKKLDLPASRNPRGNLSTLSDGRVAILANTESGSFIYLYDGSTGSVSKGLEYTGAETLEGVDEIAD